MTVLCCGLLADAAHAQQPAPEIPKAIRHNEQGAALFDAGDFEQAVAEFRKAYELQPHEQTYAHNLANAHAALADHLAKSGARTKAIAHYRAAQQLVTDLPAAAIGLTNLYFEQGDYAKAEQVLRPYLQRVPDDAAGRVLLGELLYRMGRLAEAIDEWNRVGKDAPAGTNLPERIAKAERELVVENRFERGRNRYFTVRYEGNRHEDAGAEVLRLCGEARRTVGRDLRTFPRRRVEVILYSSDQFDSATDQRSHIAGLFDGKIRVRLPPGRSDSAYLRRVVYHEYAHLVIGELCGDPCPYWLNEGLAQWESEKFTAVQRRVLATHLETGTLPSLATLEQLNVTQATPEDHLLGNVTAFAAVHYLRSRFSSRYMHDLLWEIGQGARPADALRAVYRQTYDFLDRAVLDSVEDDRRARR